ncbi:hypothetical protein, partial [uncultured Muribaculum sp.]
VLNDAPVGQPASLTGENVIEVNDNYCEFLYLICYTFLVINDCCLVLTDMGRKTKGFWDGGIKWH